MRNFSGMNFDLMLGDSKIHVETATLNITDNSTVGQTRGVPNGYIDGDVSAEGEIVVDSVNLALIHREAERAGSWRKIPPIDLVFVAGDSDFMLKIEAFGCKLSLSALLNIDSKGGSKHTHTLPYRVTAPEFVRVNGVPVLDPSETEDIV